MTKFEQQLEQQRREHEVRLGLRGMAKHFESMLVPLLLLGVLILSGFTSAGATGEDATSFGRLIFLVIAGGTAFVMLAKADYLEQNLRGNMPNDVLERMLQVNKASSRVAGVIVVLATLLILVNLGWAVKLAFWLTLIGFIAFNLPSTQSWLKQEPNLSEPKTREDIDRAQRQYEAEMTARHGDMEVQTEPEAEPDFVDPDEQAQQAEAVVLENPELAAAREAVERAEAAYDAANAEPIPENESAADGKARRQRVGGLKAARTRARNKLAKLEENAE